MKIIIASIVVLLSQGYFSPNIEKWNKSRPIFSEHSRNILNIDKVDIQNLENKQYSENEVYFFVVSTKNEDSLLIYNDNEYVLKITVEGYKNRPIKAKWVNAKLIYFEVYFNPHFGAYWLFDVENEKVVIHELQNDGFQAWQQYQNSKK